MSFMDCEAQIATWQRIFNNPWEQFRDLYIIVVSMKQTMRQFRSVWMILQRTSEKSRGSRAELVEVIGPWGTVQG